MAAEVSTRSHKRTTDDLFRTPRLRCLRLLAAALMLVPAACLSPAADLDDRVRALGLDRQVMTGIGFDHVIYRNRATPARALHVYLDGDGLRRRASHPVVLALIGNVQARSRRHWRGQIRRPKPCHEQRTVPEEPAAERVVALKLAIVNRGVLAAGSEPAKTLPEGRLTIGRGAENDWMLPDTDRTISKHHCFIEGSGDTFRLTDCSTNGVFVNDGDEPIGAGTTVILRNGDRIQIGPYEIAVELIVPARPEFQTGFPLAPARQQPVLADIVVPEAPLADERPDELTAAGHDSFFDDDDSNPGGRRARIPEDDQDVAPARGHDIDHGSPLDESFVPPAAVEQIPDDWDEDLVPGSTDRAAWPGKDRPHFTLPEPDAETPPPGPRPGAFSLGASLDAGLHPRLDLDAAGPPPGPPTAPIPPPGSNGGDRQSDSELLAAFLSGLAIDGAALSTEDPAAMMRTAGEIVRASVEGLMAVLAARREIKGELRLTATEFKPARNNPLKFSPEAQDAILQLLVRRERGFLEPKAAVVEAFADIKSHQLAVLAGMQEAWRDLLERFDPKALEQRLGQDSGLAGLLTSKKARCWDAYTEIYKVIAEEARDDFEALFGRKIARAYEEQIDKHRDQRP